MPVAQRRTQRATQITPPRQVQPPRRNAAVVENPRGPIDGYVARRSMTGTKTNTPIMETPQAVSVIGSEQIRDQKPNKFDEILRYTAGVRAGTFGADTRNDWFLIRGFKSDDIGMFLDGMQLFYSSYASWRLQPFNLERVEVLRGPSAMLYGGSSPSGIVNAISKMPPAEPIRYLETGVNNFGNAYFAFDFGGPVQTPADSGKLFHRLVGQIQNGGTQVDFTPDNNFFIAPSVTFKPDADTTFTVLASAGRNDTRGIAFLPYVGTVVDAPFGKIFRPAALPAIPASIRSAASRRGSATSSSAISATASPSARTRALRMSTSPMRRFSGSATRPRRRRPISRAAISSPAASPIRPISTTSSNIASIPGPSITRRCSALTSGTTRSTTIRVLAPRPR